MSSIGRLVKNIGSLSISTMVSRLLMAFVGILIARHFGVTQFGQYATAFAFINLFLIFEDIGMSRLLVREGSRDASVTGIYLGNTLFFMIACASVLYICMIVIASIIHYDAIVMQLIHLLGLSLFVYCFQQRPFYSVLQTYQRLDISAILEVVTSLLTVFFLFLVIHYKLSIIQLASGKLFISILMVFLSFWVIIRFARPRLDLKNLKAMLKEALPFGLSDIFYVIYFQIDVVMLSILRNESEVGLYSAPGRFINTILLLPQIITQAVLPITFRLFKKSQEDLKKTYHMLFHYFVLLGMPLSVLFYTLSKEIVVLLYGDEFIQSAVVMKITAWIIFLRCMNTSAGTILTSIDRQKIKTFFQGILCVEKILLGFILISRFGYIGAAIAAVIIEISISVMYFLAVAKYFRKIRIFREIRIPLLSGAVTLVTIHLLHKFSSVFFAVPMGLIVYLTTLIVFGFFNQSDREMILTFLKDHSLGRKLCHIMTKSFYGEYE